MYRIGRFTGAALVAVSAVSLATASGSVSAEEPEPPSVIASFEGGSITLNGDDGWGEAQACSSDGTVTRCYRSEQEMNAAEGGMTARAVCSTRLRLYRLANYGGGVLQLEERNATISLAPYGFDNDTSSYRVGACASRFYDTATGGTAYPGATSASASVAAMAAGWDNRVSSVYIL